MPRSPCLFLLCLLATLFPRLVAQLETGRLYTEFFTSEHFGGMNWCSGVALDHTGLLYAGTNDAVLSFDGQTWRTIPTGAARATALSIDQDNRLWYASATDFGVMEEDGRGGRVFHSVRDTIPIAERTLGYIDHIDVTTHGVYFLGTGGIVRWHEGRAAVMPGRRGVPYSQSDLIFATNQNLLQTFDGQTWRDLGTLPLARGQRIMGVVPAPGGGWLVATDRDGLYRLENGHAERFAPALTALLAARGCERVARLRDGTLVAFLWSGGLAFLDADGNLRHLLDADPYGRPLARIRGLAQEPGGDLWAAHANGITRIAWPPAFTVFDYAAGLPRSAIKALRRFQGRLYAGTSQGLFVLESADPAKAGKARFVLVPGCEEQIWDFRPIGDALLLVGPSIRIVTPGLPPVRLTPGSFSTSLFVPEGRDDLALIGTSTNLLWVKKKNGIWEMEPFQADFPRAVERLRMAGDDLWVSAVGAGYFRLTGFAGMVARQPPTAIEHYPSVRGPGSNVTDGFTVNTVTDSRAWFADNDSLYRFDPATRRFVAEFTLPRDASGKITDMRSAAPGLWMQVSNTQTNREQWGRHLIWREGESFITLPGAVSRSTGSVQAFLEEPAGHAGSVVWLGGDEGLVRAELPAATVSPRAFQVVLRRLRDHHGASLPPAAVAALRLPAAQAGLTVEFSADRLDDHTIRFETWLEGRDENWSAPTHTAAFTAVGLRTGHYVLHIRARDSDERLSATLQLPFVVLPPWWQTWWAVTGYFLFGAASLATFIRWRLGALRRRNVQLEALVESRTADLQAAKVGAESANHAKSAFLAHMSHELRTPLNAILGYAHILRREGGLSEKGHQQLGIVGRNGEHLLQMINEVLDLAKIEAGKMNAHLATFPLTRVVKAAADPLEQRAGDKGLGFRLELGPGLPRTVTTDEQKLRQVLLNLLGNAVKFTTQGEVVLAVTRQEGGVRFEVRDTGPGIAADQLAAIFQPFHQTGPAAAANQGTGLGLPISQRLVALLGGTIQVESEPGRRSRFWFDLPLSETAAAPTPAPSLRTVTGYQGRRRRILVTDDEPTNRSVLRDLLEPLGFEIEEAADGAACLAAVGARRFDAVLLDLRMPVLGGLDTLPRLRELPHGRDLPVVAVSASVLGFNLQDALAAGCTDFVAKPVQESVLLATLGRAMNLTWDYRDSAAPFEPTAEDTGDLPARGTLEVLVKLSRSGDLDALRAHLADALASDTPGAAFLRRLDELAAGFRTAEIRQRLADALDQSP